MTDDGGGHLVAPGRAASVRSPRSYRAARIVWLAVGGLAVLLIVQEVSVFSSWSNPGCDWAIYRDAALRWLNGGSYFLPHQLLGPRPLEFGDVLYPPAALLLFVPFALLPWALWWIVPGAITVGALIRLRPAWWAWAGMAILAASPVGVAYVIGGNPLMAMVAALFAWAAWGTPGSLVFLKPSLLPFALAGIHSRAWWGGVAVLATFSVLTLPLTADWLRIIVATQGTGGPLYGVREWPTVAIPIVAWLGSPCSQRDRAALRRAVSLNGAGRDGARRLDAA